MQYNQPYGVSDTNAPYINGNPSTGQMGSIPPAASIEFPQREIVNLITDAQLPPSNSDLHQLAKGVQSGRLIWGDDTGSVNQVSIAPSPPVTGLSKGMHFITMWAHDNTGPVVASVSGLPFIPVVRPADGAQLQPLDIRAGAIGCLAYDNVKNQFQLAWSQQPLGSQVYLTTNLDYYVGGAGASDNNDGTAATLTAGSTKGPFATPQKAMNTIANYNLNGHNINIHVADGTYPGVILSRMAGSGWVYWTGNPASPFNCLLHATSISAIMAQGCGSAHRFNGFTLQSDGPYTNSTNSGIDVATTGTSVFIQNMAFNTCGGHHMAVTQSGNLGAGGNIIINGHAGTNTQAVGGGWHLYVANGALYQPQSGAPPTLTINGLYGGQNGGGFCLCSSLAFVEEFYTAIAGFGNWSGQKYMVQANGVLTTHGSGPNYLPGTTPGAVYTGGQYN